MRRGRRDDGEDEPRVAHESKDRKGEPRARGEAERIRQEAEGYKNQTVAQAEGEVSRYLAIQNEYRLAPDVTRKRLYLETMESVMQGTNKIVIDNEGGSQGVLPYLPLPELQKQSNRSRGEN